MPFIMVGLRSMISCTCSHSSGVTIASWQPSITSPLVTGNNIIGVGADAFLVCPADKMCALIEWISQDMLILALPHE